MCRFATEKYPLFTGKGLSKRSFWTAPEVELFYACPAGYRGEKLVEFSRQKELPRYRCQVRWASHAAVRRAKPGRRGACTRQQQYLLAPGAFQSFLAGAEPDSIDPGILPEPVDVPVRPGIALKMVPQPGAQTTRAHGAALVRIITGRKLHLHGPPGLKINRAGERQSKAVASWQSRDRIDYDRERSSQSKITRAISMALSVYPQAFLAPINTQAIIVVRVKRINNIRHIER